MAERKRGPAGRAWAKLSPRTVETAGPGTYEDGGGLRLRVLPSGARSWVWRYQLNGRRRDVGLGPWPAVSLAKAREKAAALRALRWGEDRDPLAVRAASEARRLTFRAAAEALVASKGPGWRNAKHRAQWTSTLDTYAFPLLAELDVAAIETGHVLDVLRPIWTVKPETASRLRQRIEAVLGYATATGARKGENPARWRGHLDALLPARNQVRTVRHHAALGWREAPAFMVELGRREGVAARALAFAILTAARSGEVRGMTWGEVDREHSVWTVPAERMKAGREHRVPLSADTLALLGPPGDAAALVFPGATGRPMSDMTLAAVLKRMGRADLTVHGFRSTFRDWAGEATAHPREVVEAALAHRLKDKAEAAYARGDLFAKRRALMADWASYLAAPAADVVPIRAAS